MQIQDNSGIWVGDDVNALHIYDAKLCGAVGGVLQKYQAQSVLDLGCGMGHYTLGLLNQGLRARGFDGNPSTPTLTGNLCRVLDLSRPVENVEPADWVMCLEVAEHVPQPFESVIVDNLHRLNTKGIILSWAVPGQGGAGHVNERPNAYVVNLFIERGYLLDIDATARLRADSTLHWFKNTLFVFHHARQ